MEEGSTLEEVKDKMLDDMMQFEMRGRRLHGPFDYQFELERIFDHNRWKQSILLATEHTWQDDRLTDGKPLGVFSPLKVRAVAFISVESIAGRYRAIEEFEKRHSIASQLGSDHGGISETVNSTTTTGTRLCSSGQMGSCLISCKRKIFSRRSYVN